MSNLIPYDDISALPMSNHGVYKSDCVSITVWRNPLDPYDRIMYSVPDGMSLIDWLQIEYPTGFGRPIHILWNGIRVDIEDSDRMMNQGDVIGLYVSPGTGIEIGALIAQALIAAAISVAVTLVVTLIFGRPKKPGGTPKPDPVYSLTGASNSPRLGEPIPCIYGKVITVPDWASQPYVFYDNNNQYLDEILVIGQGYYDIHDIIIGDTPIGALKDTTAVLYTIFPPNLHNQVSGNVFSICGVMENVITSPEVADQELTGINDPADDFTVFGQLSFAAPNLITFFTGAPASLPAGSIFTVTDVVTTGPNSGQTFTVGSYAGSVITTVENTVINDSSGNVYGLYFGGSTATISAGPFVVGKPGVRGNRVMLDFVFPQGLYHLSDTGKLQPETVSGTITIQPIDDSGANAGSAITHSYAFTKSSNTPVRETLSFDVPTGRYTVAVFRATGPPPDTQTVNAFVWTALKFRLINSTQPVYGDVTLLAIRIRATNGIASEAASRVRVSCTRMLPPLGSGTRVATRDPADAFCDIYINQKYGARRPLSEIDLTTISAIKSHWAGRAKFDGVFNSKSTIWDGLSLVLQPSGAAPLPDGQKMSAVQDGRKAIRTQFYSDSNMVKGTMKIGYQFDKPGEYDGFQVEFRDPATFNSAYAIYPPGAIDTEQVTLFGCTDATQAGQYARLLWQRRLKQRKNVQFDSELEGLLPRFTDRIAVSSSLPRWGQTGIVAAFDGLNIRVDQGLDWSGTGHVIILRDQTGNPSDVISVSRGEDDDELILASDPGFDLSAGWTQEATLYSFGKIDSIVRDFIVSNISHSGGVVTQISGLIYNPDIYTGTLPWMEEEI